MKPSTSGPLPVRLREPTGKLGWMKWEPMNLAGGGCPFSEVRRSLGSGAVSGSSAKAEKEESKEMEKRGEESRTKMGDGVRCGSKKRE